jgi:non-ribosomal peptide synthetase component E (peptide arylation enzyme)
MDSDEELAYTDGKPCRGVEIRIDAESPGVHVAHDGEILLRGAGVFSGYVTAGPSGRCFDRLGFFRTGDIGHIRPDGRLVVTGRLKDVIIRKGETISVRDVEDLLSAHPAIAALAVVGLPDELRGERICAVIESAREQAPTLAEIQDFCRREGLMTQKIPEQLEILPRLPRNASGKILKGEVREQILRGTQEL